MDEQAIRGRIEALKRQREELVAQANLALAKLSGAIEELENLLKEDQEQDE